MKRPVALLLIVGLMSSNGCTAAGGGMGAQGGDVVISAVARATPGADRAAAAAGAVNAFGFTLYQRVAADSPGRNLVFSPASIALAVAMTRPGARGATATQLDAVLHGLAGAAGTDPINALDQALASRNGRFQSDFGPQEVALRIANAPFGQRGMAFEKAYLDALASAFGAGLRLVDYKADAEGARGTINGWVSDQTAKRIPELLAPGILDASSRLTLVNAIYMKAPWQHRFSDAEFTRQVPFTRVDGSTVAVAMMSGGGRLPYAKGDGWQAVELPYLGGQLAMTIVVPDSLGSFEGGLDAATFDAITGALAERQVQLGLPRFSMETKTDLAVTLSAMGMPDAFTGRADFSGITTQEPLFISAVIHQANIDVDENGTEAAAATAVAIAAGSAAPEPDEPVTLTVDRPFLFAIRDRATGAVLFMGRVADPSITR